MWGIFDKGDGVETYDDMVRNSMAADSRSMGASGDILREAQTDLPLLSAADTSAFTPMSPKQPRPKKVRGPGKDKMEYDEH